MNAMSYILTASYSRQKWYEYFERARSEKTAAKRMMCLKMCRTWRKALEDDKLLEKHIAFLESLVTAAEPERFQEEFDRQVEPDLLKYED